MRILKGLQTARAAGHVTAEAGDAGHPQCQKASVGIERERGLGMVIAGLMVAEKHFAPCGDPFHRPPHPTRRPRNQRVLGIRHIFGAEPAADVRHDETHLVRRYPQPTGGEIAVVVNRLGGDMGGVAVRGRVVGRDDAARFHRVGDDAVVDERSRYDMRGAGEGRIDGGGVAMAPVEAHISRHRFRDLRCAGCAGFFVGDDGG